MTQDDPNPPERRAFTSRSGRTLHFSVLGFGSAPLGNLYRAISNEQALQTLREAWAQEIRYFDTAPLYGFGIAETRVGSFLREMPRDDFLDVVCNVYPPYINCAVLPHKTTYSSHIISVVAVLIPPKTVNVGVEDIVYAW